MIIMSEEIRDFDDVVMDWMRVYKTPIFKVTDALYGFANEDNITNEAIERFVSDCLRLGLLELLSLAEQSEILKSREAEQ